MQLSSVIIAVIFVAWLATLSLRFASPPQTAGTTSDQLANVANGVNANNGQATLIVATTTDYSGQ